MENWRKVWSDPTIRCGLLPIRFSPPRDYPTPISPLSLLLPVECRVWDALLRRAWFSSRTRWMRWCRSWSAHFVWKLPQLLHRPILDLTVQYSICLWFSILPNWTCKLTRVSLWMKRNKMKHPRFCSKIKYKMILNITNQNSMGDGYLKCSLPLRLFYSHLWKRRKRRKSRVEINLNMPGLFFAICYFSSKGDVNFECISLNHLCVRSFFLKVSYYVFVEHDTWSNC